jgi:hypothetical protein
MRHARLFASIVVALILYGQPACCAIAGERIISYQSDVSIHPDSTMTVTETITVWADGENIKRGIYRDFPIEYRTPAGRRYVTSFDVLNVTRNGEPEDYFIKRMDNGRRLYIGDKDVLIPHYTITYNTDKQLGLFGVHDELYWNVTGNGWMFPINSVTATVHTPGGAAIERVEAYTGPQGSKGTDYEASVNGDGSATFSTTRPLKAYEGLTVVTAWPKGFIEGPSGIMKAAYLWRDNRHIILAVLCILILILYYMAVWAKVGRDPRGGHIVVLYDPPDRLSPAAMRHIREWGFDAKAFTSVLMNLAVKGLISIEQAGDKKYRIKRTRLAVGPGLALSSGELKVLNSLFTGYRSSIDLGSYSSAVVSAYEGLKDTLKSEYTARYFLHNTDYVWPGLAVTIAGIALCYIEFRVAEDNLFVPIIALFLLTPLAIGLGRFFLETWGSFFYSPGLQKFVITFWISIFTLFILGMNIAVWVVMFSQELAITVVVFVLMTINIAFYFLMKAPTLYGRRVMDRIEGFRVFLKVAEEDRLNMLNPPERTPELFERLLPYAIALGCENEWADQFKGAVMESMIEERAGTWYHSSTPLHGESLTHSLSGTLSSSLGGAISSSTTAPGSSSGFSSGGGFSGGGGGGGSSGGGSSGGGSSGGGGGGGGGGGW